MGACERSTSNNAAWKMNVLIVRSWGNTTVPGLVQGKITYLLEKNFILKIACQNLPKSEQWQRPTVIAPAPPRRASRP